MDSLTSNGELGAGPDFRGDDGSCSTLLCNAGFDQVGLGHAVIVFDR